MNLATVPPEALKKIPQKESNFYSQYITTNSNPKNFIQLLNFCSTPATSLAFIIALNRMPCGTFCQAFLIWQRGELLFIIENHSHFYQNFLSWIIYHFLFVDFLHSRKIIKVHWTLAKFTKKKKKFILVKIHYMFIWLSRKVYFNSH